MGNLAASLSGIALFAVPGMALTGFFPSLRAVPWTRRAGYGYPLGVAAVAGSLYMLSALLSVPIRRPAVFGVAAALTAAGLVKVWFVRRAPARRARQARRAGMRPAVLLAVLIGAAVSAGLLAEAVSEPLRDWDGRMHWSAQARYIRYEGTVFPLAVTRGQWFINHPRYPVLMPVSQVAVLEATGAEQDEFPFRAVYAAFFPALLMLLYDGARRWTGWLPAAVTVIAACGLRFLTYYADGGAMSSYSDLPLGCFFGAGLLLLLRSKVTGADGVAAGLFLGAAVLTKNEGTILAGAALLAAALPLLRLWKEIRHVPRRRLLLKGARLCSAAAVFLAVLAFFVYWRTGIPNRQDENYEEHVQLVSLLPEAVTRLPSFAGEILASTFLTWDHWTGFWWVYAAVLIAGIGVLRRRRAAVTRPLALAALMPLCVGWGAYSVNEGPEWLIKVTWERFLVQGTVPLLLLFAFAVAGLLRRSPVALKLARLSQ
ncbi:MAG TPA: hypothetical protein VH394_08615 [Thermoanaerobaculia bacterium]|nr:hypothetical protein [Thermoanaerobaculia bacterium]